MANRIWVICKDPGGTNNILPLVRYLRHQGHDVQIFLSSGGKGKDALETAGESYMHVTDAEVLATNAPPELLITTMCSGGGVGRDIIPLYREMGVPTAALQDFWGARLGTDFAEERYHPDLICANDEVGVLVTRGVLGQSRTQVVASGYPRLDAFFGFDRDAAANQGRKSHGIADANPVILYPGQIWHAGRTLLELVTALNQLSDKTFHLLVSEHPRMKSEALPEEVEMWNEARENFVGFLHTGVKPSNNTIAVSDIVVGQYSTVQIDAAVLQKPVLSILFPQFGAKTFREEVGGVMDEFPLVSLGASAVARTPTDVSRELRKSLEGRLDLREAQAKVFRLDGHNTARTAQMILTLLP